MQAATLLKHFVDERADVRLVLGDEVGRYGSGLKHLYECLRRLAVVNPHKPNGEAELSASTGEAGIFKDDNSFDEDYAIVLTTADPGTIPARVWRASHVIYV